MTLLLALSWMNFAKTVDPHGNGLPNWQSFHEQGTNQPIVLGEPTVAPDAARPVFFDKFYAKLRTVTIRGIWTKE